MRFTLISNENRDTLAPLCCKRPLTDIRMVSTTFGDLLRKRWTESNCSGVKASVAFWPSNQLLKKINGKPFIVCDANGESLAESYGSGEKTEFKAAASGILIEYPWQLLTIHEEILAGFQKTQIKGTVREGTVIDGVLILGEGSVVLPGVYIEGVTIIGKNCKIGPNACLHGFNSIGDDCLIGHGMELKNCIVQDKVSASHMSCLGDSIIGNHADIGGGTITTNYRYDGKNHQSLIMDRFVDTGRRKFGAIIGDNVHIGIHTSIYPGRKIWADISLRPGEIVKYDVVNAESTI